MRRTSVSRPGQRGVTLVVVLLILIVVTVVGVSGARMALLGERSTRFDRDYLIATQAAELALIDAEFDIRGPNTSGSSRVASFTEDNIGIFLPDCNTGTTTRGLCAPSPGKPVWATVNFLDESSTAPSVQFGTYTGRTFDSGSAGVKPAHAPRYIIEWVPDSRPGQDATSGSAPIMYRITAIGFGPREDVQVVLQTSFKKESP